MNLTEEQIIKLAPDAASEKAGRGLSTPTKWVLREYSDRAVWGHCQGSGKNPYQTQVDLQNIAFKCSCPSHKFPCKHSLGLLLLFASHPDLFTKTEEPDWVKAWLEKRTENAEKKEKRAQEKADKPIDENAQKRRLDARIRKVSSGIDELQNRLKDMLRNGLLNIPEKIHSIVPEMTRRLIDAQASGLANMIAQLGEINFYSDDWKYDLMAQMSRIYLLTESYLHLESLSPEWQSEVKNLIGFTQSKEEIFAENPISDTWMVLHTEDKKQDKITIQYNWLYGHQTHRYALFLQFVPPGVVPDIALIPGSFITSDLYFYKSVSPMRALFKECQISDKAFAPSAHSSINEAVSAFRKAVTINPFVTEVPLVVANVRLLQQGENLFLIDDKKNTVLLSLSESARKTLLLVTGGASFACFALATDKSWCIKTVWIQQHYFIIDNENNG